MPFSQSLTSRCIGRFLIDLPSDLLLKPIGGQQIDNIILKVSPASVGDFKTKLAMRQSELSAETTDGIRGEFPVLRKIVQLPAGMNGVLFDRAAGGAGGRVTRVLEVLAWLDGYLIQAELDAIDTTFPEVQDDKLLQEQMKTNVDERSVKIIDLVSRTSGRPDGKIPSQRGICIVNGFVREGDAKAEEVIGSVYSFPQFANLYLRIGSSNLRASTSNLLDRLEVIRPIIKQSQGKVLRKATRVVHGQKGHEIAYSMLTDKDSFRGRIMIDRFVFELRNEEDGRRKPRISVELHNGESLYDEEIDGNGNVGPLKPAPLSTAAASKLWDEVIPTIRVRPGAF